MIANTTITQSHGLGISFQDGTHCAGACNDNSITGSRFAGLQIYGNYVGRLGTGNFLDANNTEGTTGHHGVRVLADYIIEDASWPGLDMGGSDHFYSVSATTEIRGPSGGSGTILTLEAGAELRFAQNSELRVGVVASGYSQSGNLVANGTVDAPVVLTSLTDDNGVFWRGVYFYTDSSNVSQLTHARVSYGGNRGADYGNVNLLGVAGFGAAPGFTSVEFSHAWYYAASVHSADAMPTFDSVTFTDNNESTLVPGGIADCVRKVGFDGNECVVAPPYP